MTVNYSGNKQPEKKLTRDEIVREYERKNTSRARTARARTNESLAQYRETAERARQRRSHFDEIRREEEVMNAKRREQQRDRAASEARMSAGINMEKSKTVTSKRVSVAKPLTSKEFQAKTRRSWEQYEKERASRDALQGESPRSSERTLIDGRGTIDSRTFNEQQIISNKTINDQDKHDPLVVSSDSKNRWNTRSDRVPTTEPKLYSGNQQGSPMNNGFIDAFESLPTFVKIAIPVILILVIIVLILLFI